MTGPPSHDRNPGTLPVLDYHVPRPKQRGPTVAEIVGGLFLSFMSLAILFISLIFFTTAASKLIDGGGRVIFVLAGSVFLFGAYRCGRAAWIHFRGME